MCRHTLPTSQRMMADLGWTEVDFVLVTGDGFVDHPSFGAAIIGRVLRSIGYRVGILSQPDWRDNEAFSVFGRPKLGFLITAGSMDSMVSHYSVNKKRRKSDAYTPGGAIGKRPDRACIVYSGKIREHFGDIPIILGGLEASLRRFAHYDYWQDKVRRPLLFDSRADLLVYGMGEKAIMEIADSLAAGIPVDQLTYIRGTACILSEMAEEGINLPSFETVSTDKKAYAQMAKLLTNSADPFFDKPFYQAVDGRFLCQNPPQKPLTVDEMDWVYALPYTYAQDPETLVQGEIAGYREVEFSITSNRGCFGSCHFCALAMHQGRYLQKRSKSSIIEEAKK